MAINVILWHGHACHLSIWVVLECIASIARWEIFFASKSSHKFWWTFATICWHRSWNPNSCTCGPRLLASRPLRRHWVLQCIRARKATDACTDDFVDGVGELGENNWAVEQELGYCRIAAWYTYVVVTHTHTYIITSDHYAVRWGIETAFFQDMSNSFTWTQFWKDLLSRLYEEQKIWEDWQTSIDWDEKRSAELCWLDQLQRCKFGGSRPRSVRNLCCIGTVVLLKDELPEVVAFSCCALYACLQFLCRLLFSCLFHISIISTSLTNWCWWLFAPEFARRCFHFPAD